MHDTLLIVLVAMLVVATVQTQRLRPARGRAGTGPSARATELERRQERPARAASGAEAKVVWTGLISATIAVFGHLLAPALDTLWIVLLGLGNSSVLAVLLAPVVRFVPARRQRAGERESRGSPADVGAIERAARDGHDPVGRRDVHRRGRSSGMRSRPAH